MVAFLLTDIERSTWFWEHAPAAMRQALETHDDLIRAAVADSGGRVVKPRGEGDSAFAVFPSGGAAARAAVAVQRAFAAEQWPTPRPLRIRIGIHAGDAHERDDDYYGPTVIRCARLRSIAHGGQTLLTGIVAMEAGMDLPADVRLVDRGTHRLKDLLQPEHIFELSLAESVDVFPPLASLDATPHNLPIQPTRLIGRDADVAAVRRMVVEEDARLVTLSGPGGLGKTRLGLQVAADLTNEFAAGVFVVELVGVVEPNLVLPAIAHTLGVAAAADKPPIDALAEHIADRPMLLLLDNFEQVLAAGASVEALLSRCSGLRIIVTSRAPLQLRREREYPVPTLDVSLVTPVSASASTLASATASTPDPSALELFAERARSIRPNFAIDDSNRAVIGAICAGVDGLPLGIELAAARLRVLGVHAIRDYLRRGLDLLSDGPRDLPSRHRTLRGAIGWSYDLLDPVQQRLLRELSVFAGGFTLDAAAAVVEIDGQPVDELAMLDEISVLVNNSLVARMDNARVDNARVDNASANARFAMLQTIREFGLEQLEANDEASDARRRHAAWAVALAESAIEHMNRPETGAWLDRLEAEHANFSAAFEFCLRDSDGLDAATRLALALGNGYWTARGFHREGRMWSDRILERPNHTPPMRGRLLDNVARLAVRQNDYAAASGYLEQARAIWDRVGESRGLARTLRSMGVVAHHRGEMAEGIRLLERSLRLLRDSGEASGAAVTQSYLADALRDAGDHRRASAAYEESLEVARQAGDAHGIAYCLRGLGHIARAQGHYARARQLFRESLEFLREMRDRRCIPLCLEGLACMAVGDRWAEHATRLLGAAHAIQQATGAPAPPSESADYKRTEADARRQLGAARFGEEWTAGGAMSLEAAVDYALGTVLGDASMGGAPPSRVVADVPLSAREREVVELIAAGLSNRQISERLVLSVRTVERHIENVYNRLGISGKAGRAIVAAYAVRHNIHTAA